MPEPTRLHPAPLIGQLPAGILLWAALAFTISFCCFRFSQVDASVLLLVLAPLLWLPAMPALRLRDGALECFVMLALMWQVWMVGVQALVPAALPCGWWRVAEHAAALATCLFLAVRRDEPRAQLRLFGTGAAAAALLAVGVSGYDGLISSLQTACFGFGHVNILMNTAGPALLAWFVLCAHDWHSGRRPSARDLTILAVGLGCLLVLAVGTGRRGILVAYGAAAAWFLWRHLLARSAAVGWSVALLAVALAGAFAWHVATADLVSGRLERINIYRAAWEGAQASFPWGYGYYGALHLQWLDTEHARHLTATGGWGMHAHNEFLDTLLDGGPLALLLLCATLALLAQRVWHLRDPGLRAAWQAAGVAIGVHLMTDNCYG
ncbi:MAG: O-antigen ligase family protein, partial [Planctomycetes bacterium]|nr:O-antigen ligase family protein [Planctomycetota bacterium]